MPNNRERRTVKVTDLAIRKSADGLTFSGLTGTAIVFNTLSENLGGWREQIDAGALNECDMDDVRCLFNHDESMILGRTTSKTLALTLDKKGLHFDCSAPDTSYARDLGVSMDRGDIDQCSFAFTVAPGGSDWDEDTTTGGIVRTVKRINKLYDVSVVTYPAYSETTSTLRSAADILSERKQTTAPFSSQGDGVDLGVSLSLLRRKLELAFYSTTQ